MISKKWQEFLQKIEFFFSKKRSQRVVKRILLLLFGINLLVITYLLSIPYLGKKIQYSLGEVASEDVRVYQDIRYELPEETKNRRLEAREKQKYVFERDYQILKKIVEDIQVEFTLLVKSSDEENPYETAASRLPFIKRTQSITKNEIEESLRIDNRARLVEWATKYTTLIFDSYAITSEKMPEDMKNFEETGALVETINSPSEQKVLTWDSSKFINNEKVFSFANYKKFFNIGEPAFHSLLSDGAKKVVIHRILQHYYRRPYVSYNESKTKDLRDKAENSINPVTDVLKKGLIIVRAGDPIDADKFEKIEILNKYQNKTNFQYISGTFLVQFLLGLGVSFYIFRFSEVKFRELSSHVILHTLMFIIILFGFTISRFQAIRDSGIYLGLFVPIGFMAILTGLLFEAKVAMSVGIYISFFLYFLSGYEPGTILVSFITVIASIYSAQKMERRTQFLKGAFTTASAIIVLIIGMDLLQNQLGPATNQKIILGAVNAFLGTIFALGFLPIFESIFNLPTRFKLRELSDINHPLLRELAIEAPSTYTHSLMMANLSERAVSAIGGDSLLTRVGCLYHDIGKLQNPEFYTENKHLNLSSTKFKKMGALKSSRIIIDHVNDGIKLGRNHRLPDKVIDFIPEHHGTSTMQYFFHKALEENKNSKKKSNGSELERSMFQYPGPKPRSKETTVAMIADSLEAASRTLTNPNEEDIEALINTIIENKLSENQLDECPITFSDLTKIKATFKEALLSSYHIRPKYPSMKQTTKLEKEITNKKKQDLKKKQEKKNKQP
ncbi:MAG: HDIG domain-containing protein [Spirochaetia bacterium]|nr:HDIG domain-containing protein [Spirochaetia bacterium]